MFGLSLPHLVLLALVVLVLFGRGKVSELMGDFGKGIKSFKEGMSDEGKAAEPPAQIAAPPPAAASVNGETAVDPASTKP